MLKESVVSINEKLEFDEINEFENSELNPVDVSTSNSKKYSYNSLQEVLASRVQNQSELSESFKSESGMNFLKKETREWIFIEADKEKSLTSSVRGTEEEARHIEIVEQLFSQRWAQVSYFDKYKNKEVQEIYFADKNGAISFVALEGKEIQTQLETAHQDDYDLDSDDDLINNRPITLNLFGSTESQAQEDLKSTNDPGFFETSLNDFFSQLVTNREANSKADYSPTKNIFSEFVETEKSLTPPPTENPFIISPITLQTQELKLTTEVLPEPKTELEQVNTTINLLNKSESVKVFNKISKQTKKNVNKTETTGKVIVEEKLKQQTPKVSAMFQKPFLPSIPIATDTKPESVLIQLISQESENEVQNKLPKQQTIFNRNEPVVQDLNSVANNIKVNELTAPSTETVEITNLTFESNLIKQSTTNEPIISLAKPEITNNSPSLDKIFIPKLEREQVTKLSSKFSAPTQVEVFKNPAVNKPEDRVLIETESIITINKEPSESVLEPVQINNLIPKTETSSNAEVTETPLIEKPEFIQSKPKEELNQPIILNKTKDNKLTTAKKTEAVAETYPTELNIFSIKTTQNLATAKKSIGVNSRKKNIKQSKPVLVKQVTQSLYPKVTKAPSKQETKLVLETLSRLSTNTRPELKVTETPKQTNQTENSFKSFERFNQIEALKLQPEVINEYKPVSNSKTQEVTKINQKITLVNLPTNSVIERISVMTKKDRIKEIQDRQPIKNKNTSTTRKPLKLSTEFLNQFTPKVNVHTLVGAQGNAQLATVIQSLNALAA